MSDTSDFDDWYQTYPRHVGKRKAKTSWKIAIREISESRDCSRDEAVAWLLGVTRYFAGSDKGLSGEYCPYPATWLNQGRYDDDPAEWESQEKTPRIEMNPFKARQWRP